MAGKVTFSISFSPQLRDVLGRFRKATSRLDKNQVAMLKSEGGRLLSIVKKEAPKDTGEYSESHSMRVRSQVKRLEITAPFPLSTWIQSGTPPHSITGNPTLAFFWKRIGQFVVFRSVNHPGSKPNPYMDRSVDRWLPGAERTLNKVAKSWATDFTR